MTAATTFVTQVPVVLAATSAFRLPVCRRCGNTMFPPRARCPVCLDDDIELRVVENGAVVLATTELHNSLELHFREMLPWTLALVKLNAGPAALVEGTAGLQAGDAVSLEFRSHWKGEGVPQLAVSAVIDRRA